jgi:DNA polymerase (family 10)
MMVSESPIPHYTNRQLADLFQRMADLLEIKGDVIYKILAYRKAADSLTNLGSDINEIWRSGRLTSVPGVGKAIAEKIDELLSTSRLEFLDRLEQEVPPGLIELLQVPDVGPKKAALFWKQAGITTLAELESAARAGKLRDLPGMGEKSEARILQGIAAVGRRSERIPLGQAWPFANELLNDLRTVRGVVDIAIAGSLRRMRATVGDLDLIVAAHDSQPVMDTFTRRRDVINVLNRGETKASVEFDNRLRAQLWVHPPERFGTAWAYATGSKEHNVRLRELALKQGLSLSDQSFQKPDGSEMLCATEEEMYAILGLPWIPAEIREDRGEIQAARNGQLPALIQEQDVLAELHSHSTWSDGRLSIREMAQSARQRGRKILAITDHSSGLGVVGGLSASDFSRQRIELDQVQREMGDSILLLQGSEIEIHADGTLAYPDEVLAQLDIVIASLHTSLRQPREKVTERLLNAIRNPHVDIIGHPTGRMIPNREGADLDMDAILQAAAEHQVALEINSNPARLDLDDVYARRAIEMGIPLSINTDAHSASDLDLLMFGVATARRGWVEARHVINTRQPEVLLKWLADRS